MYKYKQPTATTIRVNKWEIGETMEVKLRRIIANKEQVKDNVALTYSDANAGVAAQYDIRSDKFETAITTLDANDRANVMKSQSIGAEAQANMQKEQGESPLKNPLEGQATNE